jgi:hypothetical protein
MVSKFDILHIAIGASISSFFCIVLVICGLYHRRRLTPEQLRHRRHESPPGHDTVEVRYVAADSSCNTTDRLLQMEHSVLNGENGKASVPHPTECVCDSPVTPRASPLPRALNKPHIGGEQNIKTVDNHRLEAPQIQKVSIV